MDVLLEFAALLYYHDSQANFNVPIHTFGLEGQAGLMKNKPDDKILDLFLQEMHHRLGVHLRQIVLFGSRARGDFDPDSDYDCLAIVDEVSPGVKNEIIEVIGEFLYNHDAVFSIFPITEEKYQQQTFDPFLINVRREGIRYE
jgi:predicted nucleotidyltransferase